MSARLSPLHAREIVLLRSTRDLRAEILSFATFLAAHDGTGTLTIQASRVAERTVRAEWISSLAVLDTAIRHRLRLLIASPSQTHGVIEQQHDPWPPLAIERPCYVFEVIRALVDAGAREEAITARQLATRISASRTPVQRAVLELVNAGLAQAVGRGKYVLNFANLGHEAFVRLPILPQQLRFRFARTAYRHPARVLVERARHCIYTSRDRMWSHVGISGTAAAQYSGPPIDFIEVPRLDLVLYARDFPRELSFAFLDELVDGLELEPQALEAAPIVITIVHAPRNNGGTLWASPGDIVLGMLDIGLTGQAIEYLKGFARLRL